MVEIGERAPGCVTSLLRRMQSGDREAVDHLAEMIYPELRRIAHACFRSEPHERVLQPTAVVHEAWLRLVEHQDHNWHNRVHFFGAAAQLMRRILMDGARARLTARRRGQTVGLEEAETVAQAGGREANLLALDEALRTLAAISTRQVRVVEMRYIAGLTTEETAAALGLTPRTIERDWAVARAWLRRHLDQ